MSKKRRRTKLQALKEGQRSKRGKKKKRPAFCMYSQGSGVTQRARYARKYIKHGNENGIKKKKKRATSSLSQQIAHLLFVAL